MKSSQRYYDYLMTDHWAELKRHAINQLGRTCFACKGHDSVEMHHMVYRTYYDCGPDDLIPLCRTCHEIYHAETDTNEGVQPLDKVPYVERRAHTVAIIRGTSRFARHHSARRMAIDLNRTVLHPNQKRSLKVLTYAQYAGTVRTSSLREGNDAGQAQSNP